ncbi:MAG: IS200/IS605 family transposase [Phormidium sp.]
MQSKYRRKHKSVTLIRYHFVWIPPWRKKVLVGGIAERLKQLLVDKCIELDCSIVPIEVMPDHVHLLLDAPPTIAPHQIMFRLKGFTSYQLRKEYPNLKKLPSLWTRSYFCGTVGNASEETVKKYIANQNTDCT